jgi:hypothetical protein
MNDFMSLRQKFLGALSKKARYIKKNHSVLTAEIVEAAFLVDFITIDEKIWALKNNSPHRPRCYCGEFTSFSSSLKYHEYCGSSCAIKDPTTVGSRVASRLQTDWAIKAQNTINERYGTAGITKLRENGMLKKYGVVNYFELPEFRNQMEVRNIEKYGVKSFTQTDEYRKKCAQTCLERYGADHYNKSDLYKELIKQRYEESSQRINKKYGVSHSSQIKIANVWHLISDFDWLFDQYIIQNKSTQQIVDELEVSHTTVLNYLHQHEIEIKYNFGYSYRCISWLTKLSTDLGIHIEHACNGGEFVIPGTKYRADGYCKSTNTVYEFHGDIFHGNPDLFDPASKPNPYSSATAGELYEKTKIKENTIINLGYNLVVIWENDWIKQEKNTKMVKTKKIQIKDLAAGMKIKTKNEQGEVVFKTVTDKWDTVVKTEDQVRLEFENGVILNCSVNHPIMVWSDSGSFLQKNPKDLTGDDRVLTETGFTRLFVADFEQQNNTGYIDITVEDIHTFFASANKEGPMVLTHNSQGGIRNASCTVYFPIWHYQFEDLIVLKNNQGTEETRVRHLDYSVVLNAFFWRRFKNKENITFFDPNEVPELYEAFYSDTAAFEEMYCRYEQRKDLHTKTISAEEVFKSGILKERTDTGRIYLMYTDNVQSQGSFDPRTHPIYQSNLCAEITLPSVPFKSLDDEGEFKLHIDDGTEITLPGQHKVLLVNGEKKKVRELTEEDDIKDLLI